MNTNSSLRFLLMVLADNSIEFSAIVGDEDAQPPFALLKDKNLRDKLSDLLAVLDDRERKIISQRFGLDGAEPKTLKEVGKKLGLTRERIRQLQNIALAKLRSRIQSDPVEKFASVKRIAIGMRSDASACIRLAHPEVFEQHPPKLMRTRRSTSLPNSPRLPASSPRGGYSTGSSSCKIA
jgi:DNA-binding CsgD family transcriptional regulator